MEILEEWWTGEEELEWLPPKFVEFLWYWVCLLLCFKKSLIQDILMIIGQFYTQGALVGHCYKDTFPPDFMACRTILGGTPKNILTQLTGLDVAELESHLTMLIFQRRQWQPTPVLLPGKSHGWRSLVGSSPWGHEESDTTERIHFHFSLSCIGEGNGTPLQSSCLENPRDRGAWWTVIYGVAQSRTRLRQLSSSNSMLIFQVYRSFPWFSLLYSHQNE